MGQRVAETRALGGVEILEELVLHGPDVRSRGGVASLASRGERDDTGATVRRINGARDQTVALQFVKQSDETRLVVPHRLGEDQLAAGGSVGQVRESDIGPHRQTVGLKQRPLGVDQPPGDARKQRSEILVLHTCATIRFDRSYNGAYDMRMHTITLGRAETRSISIAAPPKTVLELLGDARRLPEWAPAFAVAVEPAGEDWLIDTGAGRLRLRLRVSPEHGTADLLRPNDPGRGARMRVLSNEEGSEFLFTLVFPVAADDTSIAQQMTIVEAELRTVRDLCEAKASRPAG